MAGFGGNLCVRQSPPRLAKKFCQSLKDSVGIPRIHFHERIHFAKR